METKNKVIILLAGVIMFAPAVSLAQARASKQTATSTKATGINFCTNLPSLTAQINNRVGNSQTNVGNKQKQRQASVQERQVNRAQDLALARGKEDAERISIYGQLNAKAATDAQKQAITAFKTSMEAALIARRTAADAALAAYQTGLKNILGNRQIAVQTAEQNFSAAMKTALNAASAECTAGTDPAIVRQHYQAALKAAQAKFLSDRKAVDKTGPQVKALTETRNKALKTAFAAYKTAAEKARTALKIAFATTRTSTTTPSSASSTGQ